MTSVILAYNNIQFSFDYAEYLTYKPSIEGAEPDLFNFNFKWIRADFSGQALDFMRKTFGWEFVDSFIMARPDEKMRFDVTRVDIAYDFLNYQPDFVQKMVDHMMYCQQKGLARVPIMHTDGGNKYSVKFGNQLTIYIGATASDRLLRVYDKRKQFCPDGVWKEQCPSFPQPRSLADDDKRKIRQRFGEMMTAKDPETAYQRIKAIFQTVNASDFCKKGKWCTFRWIFTNATNWRKVEDGNYIDRPGGNNKRANEEW